MYHTSMTRTLSVVISSDGAHYSDGRHYATIPAGLIYDMPRLLAGFARELDGNEGVIVIRGIKPGDVTDQSWADAREAGWSTGRPGSWVTCWRKASRGTIRIHIGFLDDMDARRTPLFARETEPRDIALLLAQYHVATGSAFHATAGVSGHGAIRELCRSPRARGGRVQAPDPKWVADEVPARVRGAGPLVWKDDHTVHVTPMLVDHTFDVNAQYLAAARNARLAVDELEHTGRMPFDANRAGYWQIIAPYVTEELHMPHATRDGGKQWVTTPVVEYMNSRRLEPVEILDSYTAPGRTILRPWAEKLRGARAELLDDGHPLAALLRSAVKATYTQSIGMLGRKGGRIYRRDWYDAIVDLARMNLLRRIDRVYFELGISPTVVNVDAVTYRTIYDAGTLGAVLGVGTGVGQFKHVSTVSA